MYPRLHGNHRAQQALRKEGTLQCPIMQTFYCLYHATDVCAHVLTGGTCVHAAINEGEYLYIVMSLATPLATPPPEDD